jgi:hypothetical protein
MAKGVTDINNSNNQKSVSIDVIESHTLNITFTQYTTGPLFGITNRVTGYNPTASAQASFINATYPVADDGIIINVEPTTLRQWSLSGLFDCYDTSNFKMLLKAHGLGNSSGYTFDKVVGVVPYGDLYSSVGQPQGMIMGCVAQDKTLRSAILLVDGSPNATLAHELGHTYNLCHDTPESNWNWSQLLFNGCVNRNINGHYNGNNCDGTYCYIPNGTNLLVLHLFDAAMISGGNTTTNNPP